MDLLCIVKTVVHGHLLACGSAGLQIGQPLLTADHPGLVHHAVVQRFFLVHSLQMLLLGLQSLGLLVFFNVSPSKQAFAS